MSWIREEERSAYEQLLRDLEHRICIGYTSEEQEAMDREAYEKDRLFRTKSAASNGKCPKDGRERPVYIITNNKRELAIADGYGDAYRTYTTDTYPYGDKPLPENKYDPKDYEFERGLSGMDF